MCAICVFYSSTDGYSLQDDMDEDMAKEYEAFVNEYLDQSQYNVGQGPYGPGPSHYWTRHHE